MMDGNREGYPSYWTGFKAQGHQHLKDTANQVSNLPAISDAILLKAGAADCEMWDGHCHKF
ncbi:hypothetical protein TIFTF001_042922 [Ficus carica]|uniref:Uncharacterized protein n=1 Tax=Ficus carica TaxID=3494 RepID=A0AA88CJD9_FICCA|nr:hypothetical protein TIFTF001_042922 [Ficus carica]